MRERSNLSQQLADFWRGAFLEALARRQGVAPLRRLEDLWADFWPEEESVDDFIEAVYRWRREGIELQEAKLYQ